MYEGEFFPPFLLLFWKWSSCQKTKQELIENFKIICLTCYNKVHAFLVLQIGVIHKF